MGLFEKIFRRPGGGQQAVSGAGGWETLTAYRPVWRTWGGQLYENELVRASIDALARHSSKLDVRMVGTAHRKLQAIMKQGPCDWCTWQQILYRVRTILEMQNTCFIVPVLDEMGEVGGFFPALPSYCEVLESRGEVWLRYHFGNGQTGAMELSRCGVMTKHQYQSDLFGETNDALGNTMALLDLQNQGVQEGIKNSASYRFLAQMSNFMKPDDLAKERKRFDRENMRGEGGGLLLFPNTYTNIKQIESKPFTVDADQQKLIETNVYNYFGVNEKILQNSCIGDEWAAFYEGAIEPFAIQLSEVLTRMVYTRREIGTGNEITVTANRLQYMSAHDKMDMASQMADRGLMTRNEIRQVLQLPPLPEEIGDTLPVRGEYYNLGEQRFTGEKEPAGQAESISQSAENEEVE